MRALTLIAVLAAALVAPNAPARQAAAAKNAAPASSPATVSNERAVELRLAGPVAARAFRKYNSTHARQIQHHLADIYAGNEEFKADAALVKEPLDDGVVGPVTLRWLRRFCHDYGILASDPDFENQVVQSLAQIAGIAREHPGWVDILFSAEFEAWINEQPNQQRVRNLKIRRSGAASQVNALIRQYLARAAGAQAVAMETANEVNTVYSYDPKRMLPRPDLRPIVARLKGMSELDPMELDEFRLEVRSRLSGIHADEAVLQFVEDYSHIDWFRLTEDIVQQRRALGMSRDAAIDVRKLAGKDFADETSFRKALADIVVDARDSVGVLGHTAALVEASRTVVFQVPPTLQDDLAAGAQLSPPVQALFAGMSGIAYPTRQLLDSALAWHVQRALAMCPAQRVPSAHVLPEAQVDQLTAMLRLPETSRSAIKALRALKDVQCGGRELLDADERAHEVYQAVAPELHLKMDLQERRPIWPGVRAKRELAWEVPGCDCGSDVDNAIIYGFYPLWTDGSKNQLDFAILSRVGLYGMTFNGNGELELPGLPWRQHIPRELIKAAHKYMTRVDWVITRRDWRGWSVKSAQQKADTFTRLANNIEAMMREPLHEQQWKGDLQEAASLGRDPAPTIGDGVTINFEGFPTTDKVLFNNFITTLSAKLKDMKPARQLNIVVAQRDKMAIPSDVYSYGNLHNLIRLTGTAHQVENSQSRAARLDDIRILVMLPEGISDSKKLLRGQVQTALHGAESQRLLRDMIPVIQYDGVSRNELTDDIIYMNDNYGGMGFWPWTADGAVGAEAEGGLPSTSLSTMLRENWQMMEEPTAAELLLTSVICPNREAIRLAAWISLFAAVGACLFYFYCRGCNERLANSHTYLLAMGFFVMLPFLLLLALAVGDPLFHPIYVQMAIFCGICVGIVATVVFQQFRYQSRRRQFLARATE